MRIIAMVTLMALAGCGSLGGIDAKQECAASLTDAGFDDLVEVFRYARDAGISKEDMLGLLAREGLCDWRLYEGETVADCLGCFRAMADMVWGR